MLPVGLTPVVHRRIGHVLSCRPGVCAPSGLRKKSVSRWVLGGAALQRCDNRGLENTALATEVRLQSELFSRPREDEQRAEMVFAASANLKQQQCSVQTALLEHNILADDKAVGSHFF